MNHRKTYLGGAIWNTPDKDCKDWREYAERKLDGVAINPMRRDYRGKESENSRDIVELDKCDIGDCNTLLVNYIKPSVGTSMEVLYAWERSKHIVVVCKDRAELSPWLVYHSHRIYRELDDAIEHINNIA